LRKYLDRERAEIVTEKRSEFLHGGRGVYNVVLGEYYVAVLIANDKVPVLLVFELIQNERERSDSHCFCYLEFWG
jgi:hypothetical protein